MREYWINDPEEETIEVLNFKGGEFRGKSYKYRCGRANVSLSSSIIQGFDIDRRKFLNRKFYGDNLPQRRKGCKERLKLKM